MPMMRPGRRRVGKQTRTTGYEKVGSILAVDPGACQGWARIVDGVVQSGIVRHPGAVDERLASFHDWLSGELVVPTRAVVMERPARCPARALDSLIGMCSIARALCHKAGVAFHPVTPGTVKAQSGNGRADKEEMIRWAEKEFDRKVETHDEADALGILSCGLRLLGS